MRSSLAAALLLFMGWAAPASAQELKYFYCYAVDAASGTVLFSDMHEVGPPSERATYGAQFSSFLSAAGKIPPGAQGYCVMRPGADQIERAQRGLATEPCTECGDADTFEQVAWARPGEHPGVLLAGPPVASRAQVTAPEGARQEPEGAGAPVPGVGAYVLGRSDELDVVFTANEANGALLARQKADLKGGRWTQIVSDDRCAGWMAVAYASDGQERWYFVARGAESEGDAGRTALGYADRWAEYKPGEWTTGVLRAFRNDYEPAPASGPSRGLIGAVGQQVREAVTSHCAESPRYTTMGVRG